MDIYPPESGSTMEDHSNPSFYIDNGYFNHIW